MFVDICGYFDSSGTKNNKRRLPYGGEGVGALDPDGSRCAGAIIEHGNAHEDFVDTICAYIENWLFGFCWAFQSFRKRCYQHQNRTTGAALLHSIPKNDTSSTYWSCRALESHVLALMGAVRQYQSRTAGNLSKSNIAPVI